MSYILELSADPYREGHVVVQDKYDVQEFEQLISRYLPADQVALHVAYYRKQAHDRVYANYALGYDDGYGTVSDKGAPWLIVIFGTDHAKILRVAADRCFHLAEALVSRSNMPLREQTPGYRANIAQSVFSRFYADFEKRFN